MKIKTHFLWFAVSIITAYSLFSCKSDNTKTEATDNSNFKDKKSNGIADEPFDLKKLIGTWKSISSDAEINFVQGDSGIIISGSYFPNNFQGPIKKIIRTVDNNTPYQEAFVPYYSLGIVKPEYPVKINIKYYPDKDFFAIQLLPVKRDDGRITHTTETMEFERKQ